MSRNDLASRFAELDKSGMLARVRSYPNDLRSAASKYAKLEVEVPEPLKGVVAAGVGGSFIGALALQDLLYDRLRLPIHAIKEMELPAFVDKHYLFVAISYSGNTEETIRVVAEACRRGAPTIAVTSGGLIAEHARKLGFQVVWLPPGLPPRAAFPYILSALAAVIDTIDPSLNLIQSVTEAARHLEQNDEELTRLAVELSDWMLQGYSSGRLLVAYAYRPYLSAGYRLKTQINENAKLHAFFSEIPESNHNEIMGWEAVSPLFALLVRAPHEPPEIRHRLEFLIDVWSSRGVPFREIRSLEGSRLERLISLFYTFDLASVFLALKRGVDPTPVETISQLKKHLDARIKLRELFTLCSQS